MNNKDAFPLNATYTPSQFSHEGGVYLLFNEDHEYVGSTNNFQARWANHYGDVKDGTTKLYRTLSNEGISNFYWLRISDQIDYLRDFTIKYPEDISPTDNITQGILRNFTKYEVRKLEQAIIHAIKPSLNTNTNVLFTQDWNPVEKDMANTRPLLGWNRVKSLIFLQCVLLIIF